MKKVERALMHLVLLHVVFLLIIQAFVLPHIEKTSMQKMAIYEGVIKQGQDIWHEVFMSKQLKQE